MEFRHVCHNANIYVTNKEDIKKFMLDLTSILQSKIA